jgi:hypothetical protein
MTLIQPLNNYVGNGATRIDAKMFFQYYVNSTQMEAYGMLKPGQLGSQIPLGLWSPHIWWLCVGWWGLQPQTAVGAPRSPTPSPLPPSPRRPPTLRPARSLQGNPRKGPGAERGAQSSELGASQRPRALGGGFRRWSDLH